MRRLTMDDWMEVLYLVLVPVPSLSVLEVVLFTFLGVGFLLEWYGQVGWQLILVLDISPYIVEQVEQGEQDDTAVYILLPVNGFVLTGILVHNASGEDKRT